MNIMSCKPLYKIMNHSDRLPAQVLVLGLGNDILCDDAVGLRLAEIMRRRFADRANVTVIATQEVGLGLLDLICGFDELIIVDAIQTSHAPPGYVHELDISHLVLLPGTSPHFSGISEMLSLGKELHLQVPQHTRIFAIEVEDPYTLGHELSAELEEALPALTAQLEARINKVAEVRAGGGPPRSAIAP
jgi:hydrogenase maturation protease